MKLLILAAALIWVAALANLLVELTVLNIVGFLLVSLAVAWVILGARRRLQSR